jgi:hypothetical protein
MKGIDKVLDELERASTAGKRALVRDVRAELELVRRERDAAREALRDVSAPDRPQITFTPWDEPTTVAGQIERLEQDVALFKRSCVEWANSYRSACERAEAAERDRDEAWEAYRREREKG